MKIFFGVTFPKGLIIGALLCKKKKKKNHSLLEIFK